MSIGKILIDNKRFVKSVQAKAKLIRNIGIHTEEVMTEAFLIVCISAGKGLSDRRHKRADGNATILRIVFGQLLLDVNGTQLALMMICHCGRNDGAKDCTKDRNEKSSPRQKRIMHMNYLH